MIETDFSGKPDEVLVQEGRWTTRAGLVRLVSRREDRSNSSGLSQDDKRNDQLRDWRRSSAFTSLLLRRSSGSAAVGVTRRVDRCGLLRFEAGVTMACCLSFAAGHDRLCCRGAGGQQRCQKTKRDYGRQATARNRDREAPVPVIVRI